MRLPVTLWILCFAASASAQAPEGYEQVLIPLAYRSEPGAFGARWSTHLLLYNASPDDFVSGDHIYPLQTACPPIPSQHSVPSRMETILCGEQGGGVPAQLLYLRSDVARDAVFSLWIHEGISQRRVAQIPVVRQSMLFDGRLWISGVFVPVAGEFRTMLRVYDPSGLPARVRVVLWKPGFHEPVAESVVALRTARTEPPVEPSYGEVSIDSSSFPGVNLIGSTIVEVISEHETRKIWAFATMTDNATNDVEVILPQ